MTTISNLPNELIEQILARVPLKSMRKVRSTCKQWETLSRDESFTKMHIGKKDESRMIVLVDYNLYSVSVDFDDDHPSTEPKGKLVRLDKKLKVSQIFHCEGLLLCILNGGTGFLVWNPVWGERRRIKPRFSQQLDGMDRFVYALGYEDKDSGRSIKLLRFIDCYYNPPENQYFCYEIYDFDSGLWKTLDITPEWSIWFWNHGVSLKGNTYWCAGGRNSSSEEDEEYEEYELVNQIISFDFTRESFGPLLPLPCNVGLADYVKLSCVRDEKLAVLLSHNVIVNPYHLEIWITTKIEAGRMSWSKFLAMETEHPIYVPSIRGSFFIDEEKKVAMCLNEEHPRTFSIIGEAGYSINLNVGGSTDKNCWPYGCTYVPSLVQIKKPIQGKRKGEDSSEKHRCDKTMLRLTAFKKREFKALTKIYKKMKYK